MTQKQQIDILAELYRRAKAQPAVVGAYMKNIGVYGSDGATMENLKRLSEVDPAAFRELVYVLYPERKPVMANGDGDDAAAPAKAKSGSNFDWAGMLSGLFTATGSTLSNIYGSNGSENIIRYQEQYLKQQQKQTYIILGVVAVIGVAIIAFFVMRNQNITLMK